MVACSSATGSQLVPSNMVGLSCGPGCKVRSASVVVRPALIRPQMDRRACGRIYGSRFLSDWINMYAEGPENSCWKVPYLNVLCMHDVR